LDGQGSGPYAAWAWADAVADPGEGVAADGTIRTGADRDRVPAAFEPVLADATALAGECGASLYVYGSVANGTARHGSSDVDLLSVDLPDAAAAGQRLSARYSGLCRGVEIAAAEAADLVGDTDAAYGFRVFLRHYCVHLTGPDPSAALSAFPADARAARGFNGDIARHCQRWRQALESGTASADLLGAQAARKTLLAVAGLVSVRDRTWTTDRSRAARRWGEIEPGLAGPLGVLLSWATAESHPSREEVRPVLAHDGIIGVIVERFAGLIGLWADDPQDQSPAPLRTAQLQVRRS
jgi:Nucleotidyltransferase domain